MKEPVSLDLFPVGFFRSSMFSDRALLVWFLRRRYEFFLQGSSSLASYYDVDIVDVLHRLGGLGGVW